MRLSQRNKRPAFTLIELIVVITILTVIAALTIGAIAKSFTWIKQKNTEQTMTKLLQRIEARKMTTIQKDVEDWSINSPVYREAEFNISRDKVLKTKYLTKWSFPMTYAEAFHNVQESRLLYDPAGYPQAVAILNKLRRGVATGVIPDPFSTPFANLLTDAAVPAGPYWPGGTVPAANIPSQTAACLYAIFDSCIGTSGDELTSNEILVDSNPANGDANPRIVDAWGTPMMFLRYGNMSPTYSMGMVAGGTPLITVFGDTGALTVPLNYPMPPGATTPWTLTLATRTLTIRAFNTFPDMQARFGPPALPGKDPEDPEATLVSGRFFTGVDTYYAFPNPAVAGTGWMTSPPYRWLPAIGPGAPNGTYFLATFGYELPIGFPNNAARNYTIFAPFVIISAGGDKLWNTWDDNLDSYRLKINTSGQQ
jgi:prepilin-type N-terminal cleavage/methylation domain-containing protein